MREDKLTITILADGTIKTVADAISLPNHASAEKFMQGIAEVTDGSVERTKRPDATHAHTHHHQQHGH